MLKSFTQPAEPAPVTPKGFVRVTNMRKGKILLPCAPFELPPGVSYHDEKLFDDMSEHVADSLRDHMKEGVLSFQAADVAPPTPAPAPFLPPAVVVTGNEKAPAVPALATDLAEALQQISNETNQAVLGEWFDAGQSPDISDAILARHTTLNPA